MQVVWALVHGVAASAVFNGFLWHTLRTRPQIMVAMLPRYFTDGAPRIAPDERRHFYRRYLPLLVGLAVALTVAMTATYHGTAVGFGTLFWHAYAVLMLLNLGDGVLLDLLYIPTHRERLGRTCGIAPERLTSRNMFVHITWYEHGLGWPLVVCPLGGLLLAALTSGLLRLT